CLCIGNTITYKDINYRRNLIKYSALTIMRKAGQSFLALLVSLVLLNLLSNTLAGTLDSVVLAQSPPATPQYSDWSAPVNLGPNINTKSGAVQVSITQRALTLCSL